MRNAVAISIRNFSTAFWGSVLSMSACWSLIGWVNPTLAIDFPMWKDTVFMFGVAYATVFAAIHTAYNPSLRSIFFSSLLFTALGLLLGALLAYGEINYADSVALIALQSSSQIIAITVGTYVLHWASTGTTRR